MSKEIKIVSKSNKPENIILKEHMLEEKCKEIESQLPSFLRGYFMYLKNNVLIMTRYAYLTDILFFANYLINETDLTEAETTKKITEKEFNLIRGVDINIFLDYCRKYKVTGKNYDFIYENNNKTLSRKKSSLSVMFKQLYRDGIVENNITDSFDPIKVSKPSEREIKALQDDEVMILLDAVSTGQGLTKKEHQYWEKTKLRDKAILVIFLTYGLRLSELSQLNISSFNFSRGEFIVYRKRDKESIMPLNKSVKMVIDDYINNERPKMDESENKNKDDDALFISLQGKRMTDRQIRELVKKYTAIALKTSKGKGYSPHKLRATAATSLIGRGNSIFDVQALLDHEQVATTQLYAAHKKNIKRDLVNDMEWEIERKE